METYLARESIIPFLYRSYIFISIGIAGSWLVNSRRCGYDRGGVAAMLGIWGRSWCFCFWGTLSCCFCQGKILYQCREWGPEAGLAEKRNFAVWVHLQKVDSGCVCLCRNLWWHSWGWAGRLGGVGVGLALVAVLLRVHLWNSPQALNLVRLSASPAEEVFPGA